MAFSTGFTEIFTANTTWVVPTYALNGYQVRTNIVNVQCYGPGGNGGTNSLLFNGGGGGGGGFSAGTNTTTPGESISIQVGTTSGTQTFFRTANTIRANSGGNGGNGSLLAGGSAGATSGLGVGTIRYQGGAGAAGGVLGLGGAGGGGAGDTGNGSAGATNTGGAGGPSDGGTGGARGAVGAVRGGGGGAASAGARGQVNVNYERIWFFDVNDSKRLQDTVIRSFLRFLGDSRLFTDTSRRAIIYRLLAEARLFTPSDALRLLRREYADSKLSLDFSERHLTRYHLENLRREDETKRIFTGYNEELREISDDDYRTVTRAISEDRLIQDSPAVKTIERFTLEDRLLIDTVSKVFTKENSESVLKETFNASRAISRDMTEGNLREDSYIRTVTREYSDSALSQDNLQRVISRTTQEDQFFLDNLSKTLTRDTTEESLFEDVSYRIQDRENSENRIFQDTVSKVFTKENSESVLKETFNASRAISRDMTEGNLREDFSYRFLDRSNTEELQKEDQEVTRSISRENLEEKLNEYLVIRFVKRVLEESRLFDDMDLRTITRIVEDSRLFQDAPAVRTLIKEDVSLMEKLDSLVRFLDRDFSADSAKDDRYSATIRKADFFGYGLDRELLMRHAHEWSNEHYGHLIHQILRRIIEITRQSDDWGT